MKKMTVHDKAIRLLEGGIVQIEGKRFRVKRFPDYYDGITCFDCSLQSICRQEHLNICAECEAISNRDCCLEIANKGR